MSDNVFGVLRHNLERAKKSRPYSIVLKMTNTCNLDCTYCYVSHDNARFLKKEYVEKLFDELMIYDYQSACCVFHGGEPLICYREINEIISLLKRKEYPLISQFNSRKFEDVGECNVCEVKHICNMGCAATNLLENNNDFCCFSKTAALCEYYKVIIGTMRQMYAQDVDALKIFISG